jgi:tetratricopeptide (TPR) repeat protein
VVLLIAVGIAFRSDDQPIDENRVLVFPLRAVGASTDAGDAVATYIGYALEGTEPLRWEEARDWLRPDERAAPEDLSLERAVEIGRERGAGFFIDGSILGNPDELSVVLRLYDIEGDSLIGRFGETGEPGTSEGRLATVAMTRLLGALVEPGRTIDVAALSMRDPAALAHFHQGEVEYRNARFARALEHYRQALEADSLFALAAVKGAQAMEWMDAGVDAELTRLALAHDTLLPIRFRAFARGAHYYNAGEADSALVAYNEAIDLDPDWGEAWMGLGEVYYHLLPRDFNPDSLAEAAFSAARRLDPEFAPPLFHLAELAIRRGQIDRADSLVALMPAEGYDPEIHLQLETMLRCVRGELDEDGWREAAAENRLAVLGASLSLAADLAWPECAEAGFRTLMQIPQGRWGALLAYQGLLAAQGRLSDLVSLVDSEEATGLPGSYLYLMDVAAGAELLELAERVVRTIGVEYPSKTSPDLWLLAQWAIAVDSLAVLGDVYETLAARALEGGSVRDQLIADVVAAHLSLAQGDTTSATAMFEALWPAGPRRVLLWNPWEALALERLTLTRLYLASGRADEALALLIPFTGQRAAAELAFLPAAYQLAIPLLERAGHSDQAARLRSRLNPDRPS